MSLHQVLLNMSADLGWDVDRVLFLLCNIHFVLGAAIVLIVRLLFHLLRKLVLLSAGTSTAQP